MVTEFLAGLLQFSAAYALVLVVPGTVMLTTGSIAALQGLGPATNFILGVAAGAGLITASVGCAINTISSEFPSAVGQIGSAALLLVIAGIIVCSSDRSAPTQTSVATRSVVGLIFAGLATALASPLTAMFATAMFSRPSSSQAPVAVAAATLIVVVANLAWYGALAMVFSHPIARSALLRHRRGARAASAAVLVCLAFLMLVQAGTELLTAG
jgi:threonine/homoserine/homoserine lactone efflux protein